MRRFNIDFGKGLVNRAIGIITEIIWGVGFRRDQMYEQDIPDVSIDFGKGGIHLINLKSNQFLAKSSHGTTDRRMLPLVLSLASIV